jgi:hypothetical protein
VRCLGQPLRRRGGRLPAGLRAEWSTRRRALHPERSLSLLSAARVVPPPARHIGERNERRVPALIASHDAELRPVPFRLEDRRLATSPAGPRSCRRRAAPRGTRGADGRPSPRAVGSRPPFRLVDSARSPLAEPTARKYLRASLCSQLRMAVRVGLCRAGPRRAGELGALSSPCGCCWRSC